jgi:3-oxoacyl-[acyl-carrier protein] reductase
MMKTALITGSSNGLGLEIARRLLLKGVRVIFTGRSQEKLDVVTSDLDKNSYISYVGDLTHKGVIRGLFSKLDSLNIHPDFIIHSLGGKVDGDKHPLSTIVLQQSLLSIFEIAVEINSYYLPVMKEKKHGRIIHISSDASITGQSAPGYAAAKAAINAYVKSTARFYVKYNIMLCAVLPGIFEYEGSAWSEKKMTQPKYYQHKIAQMPLGRFLTVSEVAENVIDIGCGQSIAPAGSLIELTGAYI